MPIWSVVRWGAQLVRKILLPNWISQGRLSHRVAVALAVLLLVIELLPAENLFKQEARAAYATGVATVAGAIDASWRPRLQAAAALGELRAELDRLYWLEAETTVMHERLLAREAHLAAQIAEARSAGKSDERATRALAVLEQELQHVQQLAAYYAATAQQTRALRLEAEVSRRRLLDYLDMLDTAAAYDNPGARADAIELLRDEFERRRRIILERSRLESNLGESPVQ